MNILLLPSHLFAKIVNKLSTPAILHLLFSCRGAAIALRSSLGGLKCRSIDGTSLLVLREPVLLVGRAGAVSSKTIHTIGRQSRITKCWKISPQSHPYPISISFSYDRLLEFPLFIPSKIILVDPEQSRRFLHFCRSKDTVLDCCEYALDEPGLLVELYGVRWKRLHINRPIEHICPYLLRDPVHYPFEIEVANQPDVDEQFKGSHLQTNWTILHANGRVGRGPNDTILVGWYSPEGQETAIMADVTMTSFYTIFVSKEKKDEVAQKLNRNL